MRKLLYSDILRHLIGSLRIDKFSDRQVGLIFKRVVGGEIFGCLFAMASVA